MESELARLLDLPEQEKIRRGVLHTPREIAQQPATWRNTLRLMDFLAPSLHEFLTSKGIGVSSGQPNVLLVGAGTSDYIGRAVSSVFRKAWNCDVAAVASTDLLTNMEDFIRKDQKYLMISFSRSGDSSEGVAVLEQVIHRYPDAVNHLLVTCNANGAMAQLPQVRSIVLDDAVNDRSLAMTSSFTNMVLAGQYLANIFHPAEFEETAEAMIELGTTLLAKGPSLAARLAKRGFTRMCFLGAGALAAAAEESSLKVLELNAGKIATMAQSPLGLRHGPLSFVNKSTLVVLYLSADPSRQDYELDLMEDLKQKDLAGETVIVAPQATNRIAALSDNVLSLDCRQPFPDAYRPAVDTIFGQLIGLFSCLENNGKPDSPSDGAINRVVRWLGSTDNLVAPSAEVREADGRMTGWI